VPCLKWSYGVTTVPSRREGVLPETLRSLREAGFDKPRLFIDGCDNPVLLYEGTGLPYTCRGGGHSGVTSNWLVSLLELYTRDPWMDRYAVFQDDLVCVRGLKRYLEEYPYPDGTSLDPHTGEVLEKGYLNLYTFAQNEDLVAGKQYGWTQASIFNPKDVRRLQMGRGAVGLVFDRATVVDLLGCRELVERFQDKDRGHKAIDGGVVHVLNKAGYREYVHNPSLVQHTGKISAMDKKGNGRLRVIRPYHWPDDKKAQTFPGETFDVTTLLKT
jgi:hypothetical protein